MNIVNTLNPPTFKREQILGNKSINATAVMDKGGYYHTHDYWELFFMVSGDAIHHLNGTQTKISSRDLFLLRPGDKHCLQRITPPGEYYLYWDIYMSEDVIRQLCDMIDTEANFFQSLKDAPAAPHLHLDKSELSFFVKLISSNTHQKDYYTTIVYNALGLLLHPSQNNSFADFPNHIRALHNYISENFLDKDAIQTYIQNLGYCQKHISRQYKKYFNKTMRDYIIECKLEYSKILLRSADNTITDIASLLGFSCDAAFITSFKNTFGFTPHKWRKIKSLEEVDS